jgi:hypothetical protein
MKSVVSMVGVAAMVAACGSDDATSSSGQPTGSGGSGATTTSASGGSGASGGATGGTGGTGGDGGTGAGMGGAGGDGGAGGSGPLTVTGCYADQFVTPLVGGPDYDQFGPVVGSHCLGTNHQDITNVERVVFLGDSVTVGTPPQLPGDFYRTKVASALAQKFALNPPNLLWQTFDPFNGTAIVQESGDFASCAKWGARTDDLGPTQLPDCFTQGDLAKRTLVVMTIGGNDLNSLAQDAIDGVPQGQLWTDTMAFVQLQRDALDWLLEPGRFPNGVFVVFTNVYEFTDGTGDVQTCDVSGLAGFDEPVPNPQELAQMVIWANEQFVKMAVDTGTDVLFLLEEFCGHGFNADNPTAPCYRGPGQPVYFDLTCIHPNVAGHDHITNMFMSVVNE